MITDTNILALMELVVPARTFDLSEEFYLGVIDDVCHKNEQPIGHHVRVGVECLAFYTGLICTEEVLGQLIKRMGLGSKTELAGLPVIVVQNRSGVTCGLIPIVTIASDKNKKIMKKQYLPGILPTEFIQLLSDYNNAKPGSVEENLAFEQYFNAMLKLRSDQLAHALFLTDCSYVNESCRFNELMQSYDGRQLNVLLQTFDRIVEEYGFDSEHGSHFRLTAESHKHLRDSIVSRINQCN